jgi:hypothetical protein
VALRDDRRGRRATIFASGPILSPRFETNGTFASEPAVRPWSIAEAFQRWLGRIVSKGADESTRLRAPSGISFKDRVSVELKVQEETQRDLPEDSKSDPADDAFEVSSEIGVRRERIVPITRRRLRPLPTEIPDDDPDRLRELLRSGSDAERALAIDTLILHGLYEELVPALGDRLEVLAAKAALGLARSSSRADLIAAIKPHVSEGRLGAILVLLAGLRE